jgi:ArsR family transcriptional regulator, arsenate/arsenite/antimonite-responsive transcriptional repressor
MAASSNKAFKALADPTRREILSLLRRGEMTAGELAERFDMTKPTMSHHFGVLKDADLLTSRRDGQTIWYSLNTTVVQDLMAWAMDLIRGNGDGPNSETKTDSETTKGVLEGEPTRNKRTNEPDKKQSPDSKPPGGKAL